jgi:hypothetical protein
MQVVGPTSLGIFETLWLNISTAANIAHVNNHWQQNVPDT